MKEFINKSLVNIAVSLVISLILLVLVITYHNNKIIEKNRLLQKQSEDVKVTVSQFAVVIIHNLDLGLRGYALFKKDKYLYPLRFAFRDKDSLFLEVEKALIAQEYPLQELHQLKDSVDAYATFCMHLKNLFDNGQMEEFYRLSDLDKGYKLWLQYEKFANKIYAHEDGIKEKAKQKYYAALKGNYLAQLLLFLISVPTLLFTAFHAHRKFAYAKKLAASEAKNALLLAKQNETLERLVEERTQEIESQNKLLYDQREEIEAQNEELLQQQEEIFSQRDMLALQNEELYEAQTMIEKQNKKIKAKNKYLKEEVKKRTNKLLEYNQQLEQFAFMAAHNLRAPVARILGLGKILTLTAVNKSLESVAVTEKLVAATQELDEVIKDLAVVLEIESNDAQYFTKVNFKEELDLVKSNLENEILETGAQIFEFFDDAPEIITNKAYADSILYNLISNAIKYRHPARKPTIEIRSFPYGSFTCLSVSDNGLGINQEYLKDLFNFYVRFHFHVEGKGLGLYLVKTQVRALGGKIEVESKVDYGTTFKVYFKNKNLAKLKATA